MTFSTVTLIPMPRAYEQFKSHPAPPRASEDRAHVKQELLYESNNNKRVKYVLGLLLKEMHHVYFY